MIILPQMADKAQLEDLLKKKIAELEISNPTLSEEETKKQKQELKAELVNAKAILDDKAKSLSDKIKLLYNFALEEVRIFVHIGVGRQGGRGRNHSQES